MLKQFDPTRLLMGRVGPTEVPTEHWLNLSTLAARLNALQDACGVEFKLNDAYRRLQDQPKNAALRSKHLIGAAADLDDNDAAWLWHWMYGRLPLLRDLGLWLEDPRWTHGAVGTWMHVQIYPPGSGHRIFVPSTAPASAPSLWDGFYDKSLDGGPTHG